MAGMVLSSQKLDEMNDANFKAMKTAKGQLKEAQALNADLHAKMALMQKSIDVLTAQRTTAEGQIKRLLDLLERTQAQRDAAQAELNRVLAAQQEKDAELADAYGAMNAFLADKMLYRDKWIVTRQSRGRLVWAFKRMKQAARHWSEAHSRELARVTK